MTKRINAAKTSEVEKLKTLIRTSKSVAVVNYTGLKVPQATELRKSIKNSGGQLLVTKNTLFKIALDKDLDLTGANAFIFSQADEVSAVKAVADFAKKNQVLTFKSGLLGDRILSAAEIAQLAATPPKDVNIQLLTANLKSPIFRLTSALNWNIGKLVRTLKEVSLKHVR